jgi:toxin FitB
MHLLDTDVVSELRKVKAGRADPNVTVWIGNAISNELYVSAITLHELEHGVLLEERSDPARGSILRRWLDDSVARAFSGRVLPVDERVARRAAAFHVPDAAPFRDALIGATASVHGLVMVTRNERHFERLEGLRVMNPWRG